MINILMNKNKQRVVEVYTPAEEALFPPGVTRAQAEITRWRSGPITPGPI